MSYRPTKAQVLLSIRKPHVERAFTEALRAFKPDVIVFHHLVRLSLWLPVLAQRAGIPSAYVLHDFYPICPSYSLFAWDSDVCPGLNDASADADMDGICIPFDQCFGNDASGDREKRCRAPGG